MKCDFCSEDDPGWAYPAVSFQCLEEIGESIGAWAACEACHALIEAGQRAALAERCFAALVCARPEVTAFCAESVIAMMAELHGKFFESRLGAAIQTKQSQR